MAPVTQQLPSPFGHVATAMITPFTPGGEVDHEAAWRLARHLSDTGTDTLVITGTTGESPTLSDDEKVALYHTVVEAVKEKDAMVMAGTGTYDTAHSVHLTERAAEAGVGGVLAVNPYYNKPPQRGLVAHFNAIAAVGPPVMLYNIPGRTSGRIELDTLAELGGNPNIVAVKDAAGSLDFTSRTVNTVPNLAVYSGDDSLTLPMMSVGAVGVVSVIAHLAGRQVRDMVRAAHSGDWEEARRLHHLLLPLCQACFLEPNPMPVKAAMNQFWGRVGSVRLPLVDAAPETLAAIEKALSAVNPL
jgi:4-hydroxy-tetrahydrodipicolinate synthase